MKTSNRVDVLLKEPLFHFFVIGALLFIIFALRNPTSLSGGSVGSPEIVVTQDDVRGMNNQFSKIWQRLPTTEEQKVLVEDFIRNEIYYREALAIGLDRDDAMFRRLLRQKMEFIYEDIASIDEPTDKELTVYLNKHREKYSIEPQISFRQVYINMNKRGKNAQTDAEAILAELKTGANSDAVGDSTLLGANISLSSLGDIKQQFGDDFAKRLFDLKLGEWVGPIKSGYGLHLIFVKEHVGAHLPDLKEIHEVVKRDWMIEKQQELKDAAYAKIRQRYVVRVEQPMQDHISLGPTEDKKVIE